MNGLCIIKPCDVQLKIDSDIYTDFFTYDLSNGISKDYSGLINILLDVQESAVSDVLFVLSNDLYFIAACIMREVFTKKKARMFIIPEYKMSWMDKSYLIEELYVEVDYQKPRLPQYQVHLTDMCNLNCKGCGHFCNIVESPNFLDPQIYKRDIEKLKEKFWGVRWIYLLGGEPLLHKQVYKFMAITREVFPDADIRLTTNGLLLPDMPEEFWQAVRKNHIHIEISQYKKTREKWNLIQLALVENAVPSSTLVQTFKDNFFKHKTLEPHDNPKSSYQQCLSHECHYLRDGKLYLCPCVPLNQFFYNYFKMEMPYEPQGIDLYNYNLDGWELLKELERPNEACMYCTNTPEWYKWDVRLKKDASMSDWIVGMNNTNVV